MLRRFKFADRECVSRLVGVMSGKVRVNDELACILNLKLIINHFSSRITLRPEKKKHRHLVIGAWAVRFLGCGKENM